MDEFINFNDDNNYSDFWQMKNIQSLLHNFLQERKISPSAKRDYLQFVIRALKVDIINSTMSRLLFEHLQYTYADAPDIASRFLPAPWAYGVLHIDANAKTQDNFFCDRSSYMAWPAEVRKLVLAIEDIEREGFQQQKNYTDGLYFPELNFTIIRNGRHHVTASMQKECITLDLVEIYPLTPLFPYLNVNGANWEIENNTFPIIDSRFAILYDLTRLVYRLDAANCRK